MNETDTQFQARLGELSTDDQIAAVTERMAHIEALKADRGVASGPEPAGFASRPVQGGPSTLVPMAAAPVHGGPVAAASARSASSWTGKRRAQERGGGDRRGKAMRAALGDRFAQRGVAAAAEAANNDALKAALARETDDFDDFMRVYGDGDGRLDDFLKVGRPISGTGDGTGGDTGAGSGAGSGGGGGGGDMGRRVPLGSGGGGAASMYYAPPTAMTDAWPPPPPPQARPRGPEAPAPPARRGGKGKAAQQPSRGAAAATAGAPAVTGELPPNPSKKRKKVSKKERTPATGQQRPPASMPLPPPVRGAVSAAINVLQVLASEQSFMDQVCGAARAALNASFALVTPHLTRTKIRSSTATPPAIRAGS